MATQDQNQRRFEDDLQKWTVKLHATGDGLLPRVGQAVHQSIVEGSSVTGAPGQPVGIGTLRLSWTLAFPDPDHAEILTRLAYAPGIEDAVGPHGPIRLRSAVGGFHSVKLTRAGFDRLVESVVPDA